MSNRTRGISKAFVEALSREKGEPRWMLQKRLEAYRIYEKMSFPPWGPVKSLKKLDLDSITHYVRPDTVLSRKWKDVPTEIRETYDALGIPEGEKKYLAGVGAQYESEMVYHALRKDLQESGIVFEDMGTAVCTYPDIIKEYFGSVIRFGNNVFSALNGAVWSGGSFVYIPQGVSLEVPLHNFFQMGTPGQGQFERTLIVADQGSDLTFLEGCVAPLYSELSLHAGVVEIIVKKGARVTYTTMQNWSKNVYNLVTKGSYVEEQGQITWIDGNVGSGVTMKYPSMVLAGPRACGKLTSVAFAGKGQEIDSGGTAVHMSPETISQIESKSIVTGGGRSTFRGNITVHSDAESSRSSVSCTSLHLDENATSDAYPKIVSRNASATIEHEASVTALSQEQLLFLQSRGIREETARSMIIGGFIEPFTNELPMEYAVEFERLVDLEMSNEME